MQAHSQIQDVISKKSQRRLFLVVFMDLEMHPAKPMQQLYTYMSQQPPEVMSNS